MKGFLLLLVSVLAVQGVPTTPYVFEFGVDATYTFTWTVFTASNECRQAANTIEAYCGSQVWSQCELNPPGLAVLGCQVPVNQTQTPVMQLISQHGWLVNSNNENYNNSNIVPGAFTLLASEAYDGAAWRKQDGGVSFHFKTIEECRAAYVNVNSNCKASEGNCSPGDDPFLVTFQTDSENGITQCSVPFDFVNNSVGATAVSTFNCEPSTGSCDGSF